MCYASDNWYCFKKLPVFYRHYCIFILNFLIFRKGTNFFAHFLFFCLFRYFLDILRRFIKLILIWTGFNYRLKYISVTQARVIIIVEPFLKNYGLSRLFVTFKDFWCIFSYQWLSRYLVKIVPRETTLDYFLFFVIHNIFPGHSHHLVF